MGSMEDYNMENNVKAVAATLIKEVLDKAEMRLAEGTFDTFVEKTIARAGDATMEYGELFEEKEDNPTYLVSESVYSSLGQLAILAVTSFDLLMLCRKQLEEDND